MRSALVLTFITLSSFGGTLEFSDSGIVGPQYQKLLATTENWQREFPTKVSLLTYGASAEGRPLRLVIVGNRESKGRRPAMVMTGSTHGNEYLNLEDRIPYELLRKLALDSPTRAFVSAGGVLVVVPVLNPDGYEHRVRANANGVDLNRDWAIDRVSFKGFQAVETRALRDQLDDLAHAPWNLDYKITVDYHCCVGALLKPWSYTGVPMPDVDRLKHTAIERLAVMHLKIATGTTGQVLGYFPLGTTKDYYYAKYHALSFTFEGRFGRENQYLGDHVAWWESMFSWWLAENARTRNPIFAMFGPIVP